MSSERYPDLEKLVGGMSHHIKNILNKLEGGAYMVRSGIEKERPEILKRGWSIVQDNIERASDLLMSILLYAREGEPELEEYAPKEILEEVAEVIKGRLKDSKIGLSKEVAQDVEKCLLDPKAIRQALINICTYALDSLDKKAGQRDARLELAADREKGGVKFRISTLYGDQWERGPHRMRFEELYQRESEGRGFGLRVAEKIVQGHGGTVTLESVPGKGRVFKLHLPTDPTARARGFPIP